MIKSSNMSFFYVFGVEMLIKLQYNFKSHSTV